MSVRVSRKELVIGQRTDGSKIALPLIEYKGSRGPSLFIGVGIHGDELTGLASIWKLYDFLKGMEIHGTITIMPAMNPDGLSYNVRGIPEAEVDLNRLYPGKRTGYIAERITAKIWGVAKKHDAIIDFHTMGPSIPFVLTDLTGGELKKKMDKLAEATGITVLEELSADEYALQNLGASLGGVATAAGIPNITIELSGSKGVDWSNVEAGFLSAKNVLVNMGIVKGTHTRITSVPVIRAKGFRRDDVFAGKPGIIEYAVKMGDSVRKGATLARIRNVFGEIVEEVKMPEDGYMVSENLSHSAWTGSYVACIAVKVKKKPR